MKYEDYEHQIELIRLEFTASEKLMAQEIYNLRKKLETIMEMI